VYGFQPLAIIYSVPAALLQWSFIASCLVLFSLPWRFDSVAIGILSCLFIAVVFIIIYFVHGWQAISFSWFTGFWSLRSDGYGALSDGSIV
jgi:hypothetical protein